MNNLLAVNERPSVDVKSLMCAMFKWEGHDHICSFDDTFLHYFIAALHFLFFNIFFPLDF